MACSPLPADASSVMKPRGRLPTTPNELLSYPWYFGDIDRTESMNKVKNLGRVHVSGLHVVYLWASLTIKVEGKQGSFWLASAKWTRSGARTTQCWLLHSPPLYVGVSLAWSLSSMWTDTLCFCGISIWTDAASIQQHTSKPSMSPVCSSIPAWFGQS